MNLRIVSVVLLLLCAPGSVRADDPSFTSQQFESLQRLIPPQPGMVSTFFRRYLIDLVRVGGNGGPRRPNDVLGEQFQVIVESVNDDRIRLRFDGSARLATHDVGSGARKNEPKIDDFQLFGYATYDRSQSQFKSFDLTAYSETGHYDEIHKKVLPLGVAVFVRRQLFRGPETIISTTWRIECDTPLESSQRLR